MHITESLEETVMRKETIITDWDAILQMIELDWILPLKDLVEQMPIYEQYFNKEILDTFTLETLLKRKQYYLEDFLAMSDEPLPKEIFDVFEYCYTGNVDLYYNAPLLGMFEVLRILVEQDYVNSITILTHTQFGYEGDPRKKAVFEELFLRVSNKFRLIQIPSDVPKWKYIKEHNLPFTIFIDDRDDIIRGVAENCGMRNKQFWMPSLGYNQEITKDKDFLSKLEMHGSQLYTYDQKFLGTNPEEMIGVFEKVKTNK